jgi:ferritin-like metal-binding protein YciE
MNSESRTECKSFGLDAGQPGDALTQSARWSCFEQLTLQRGTSMTTTVKKTFGDLYAHELEMLVSAERQMIKTLPRLANESETAELQKTFLAEVDDCESQLKMLHRILKRLGKPLNVPLSRGIQSLLTECSDLLESFPKGNLRDAVMIAHMQRAEHYKMAAFLSVHEYAKLLGDKEAEDSLGEAAKAVTLMSRTLGGIAIQVNAEAYVDTRVEDNED